MARMNAKTVVDTLDEVFDVIANVDEEIDLSFLDEAIGRLQELHEKAKDVFVPEVTLNPKGKVVTIAFSDKPDNDVREALRNLGFRWDRQNSLWKATGDAQFKQVDGTEAVCDYNEASTHAIEVMNTYTS